MNPRRRQFLIYSSSLAAAVALSGCNPGANNAAQPSNKPEPAKDDAPQDPPPARQVAYGAIIGSGKAMDEQGRILYMLPILDIDAFTSKDPALRAKAAKRVDMTFYAHGISVNPANPARLAIFEKRGPGACEIDVKTAKVTRAIDPMKDCYFYGHGAYTLDGKRVFAVESEIDNNYRGVVSIRDSEKFSVQGTFPTYGQAPHDCHLVDHGKTLVFTNGGAPIGAANATTDGAPCVTFVDAATHKLLDTITFDNPRVNAGHCALTRAGDIAIVSAPRDGIAADEHLPRELGGLTVRAKGLQAVTVKDPPEVCNAMLGESLSVAIHEPTGVVGVTNPSGNLVTFWDLKTGKFKRKLTDFAAPRGIALTLDEKFFLISYGDATEQKLLWVSAQTLEPFPDKSIRSVMMSGSHIVSYRMPA